MKHFAMAFYLLIMLPIVALADITGQISFQGTLTDPAGVVLDTTVVMQFEIYTDSTGGTRLWGVSRLVDVHQGIFNVLLGRTLAIPDSVFEEFPRWLTFSVEDDPYMEPRLRMAAVGYAMRAAQSDTADYARSAPAAGDGDWTVITNDMYSTVSGNVGIGKSNPGYKLDVEDDGWRQIMARGTDPLAAGGINVLNDVSDWAQFALRGSGAASYPGDLVIGPYSQTENIHLGNGNYYPKMTITSGGKVGIGITEPITLLDVRSPTAIGDYFRGIHYGYNGDDGGAWISTWASSIGAYAGGAYYHNAGNWTAKSTSASSVVLNSGHIIFNANTGLADDEDFFPTERMRITNAGNVGIGMTGPASRLEVAGTVHSTSGGFKFPDGSTQTSAAGGDGHSLDADDGSPVDAVYVDADGDVGIGVLSPAARLDVHHDQDALSSVGFYNTNISSSFDAGIQLVLGDNNGPPKLTLRQSGDGSVHHSYISHVDNSSSHLILENQNAVGRILLKTNSENRISIDENGDVGIGAMDPAEKLEVAGNLLLSDGTDNDDKLQIADAGGNPRLNLGTASGAVGVMSGSHLLTFLTDTDNNSAAADFIWGTNGTSGSYSELMRLTDEGVLEVGDTVYCSSGGFKFPDGTTQTSASGADGHSLDAADGSPTDAVYVDNIGQVGIGTNIPMYKMHVYSDTSSPTLIYSRKDVTGSSWAAAVMGVSSTRNFGYLGGEMATSSEPISNYNYGVYGRVQGTGWGGFGGMFYNTSGNWAALAGDTQIGYDYGIYAKNSNANVGYLAGGSYGAYGQHDTSGCYGFMGGADHGVKGSRDSNHYGVLGYSKKRANYFLHLETEADGDGQATLYTYRSRDSRNDGTGYGDDEGNYAIQGYNLWGDEYTFGTAGHNFNDFNRCGGALGANYGGDYWGSLGYRSSGSVNYGGYFVSTMTGNGKGERGDDPAIGIGAWGELFGADIHGQVYGTYTEGGDYALYSHGTVFKDDLDVHLQHGRGDETSVLYTNVSTDVTVQTSGFATLSGGKSFIRFDEDFRRAVSSDVPIVVTVTPIGDCNGVHLSGVSRDGFNVVENNAGKSGVQVAFIAVGRRAGYESPTLPAEVVSAQYVEKVSRGLHNDGDTRTDGEGLYLENGRLIVGVHSSTLPDLNKREEDLEPFHRMGPEETTGEEEPVRRSRGSNN